MNPSTTETTMDAVPAVQVNATVGASDRSGLPLPAGARQAARSGADAPPLPERGRLPPAWRVRPPGTASRHRIGRVSASVACPIHRPKKPILTRNHPRKPPHPGAAKETHATQRIAWCMDGVWVAGISSCRRLPPDPGTSSGPHQPGPSRG